MDHSSQNNNILANIYQIPGYNSVTLECYDMFLEREGSYFSVT